MNCPKCGKTMVQRNGKFGDFLGCSGYPRCKTIVNIPKNGMATEKKELRRIEKLSDYQQSIEDWVKNSSGHGVVKATAGSGKTRTQEHVVAVLIEDLKIPAEDIIYLAFNSHVVKEAIEKGLPAQSTHQVGLKMVSAYVGKKVKVDENKVTDIIKNLIQMTWDEEKWMVSPVSQIVSKLKNTLAPHDNVTQEKICDKFGIEINGSSDRIFELVRMTMERNNKQFETIDFDDMLYLPVKYKMSTRQYKWVLGDEVQDWNRAQIELIQKLVAKDGRVLAVGDEHQCQPGGTQILVLDKLGNSHNGGSTFKTVNIEDLKVGDEIVSYSTLHGCFIYRAKVNGISKRLFNGRMRRIRTQDGKQHEVTPNHFCLARWKKEPKKLHCVYLMKKGDWFRVGTTHLFGHKDVGLGPSGRMTVETADCYWILSAFENRMEALIEEQFVSYYYGIPQTRFFGFDGYGYEQPIIDGIFEKLLSKVNLYERANTCLLDYNREIEYPFCSKSDFVEFQGKKIGRGAKLMKIRACNLMSEWMLVPSVPHTFRTSMDKLNPFVGFEIDVYQTNNEFVYGLDVDKHHTYISNGILTGNSMYGFRGAAPDAMQKIEEAFNAEILPLSISYRNPISHVELINRIFPEIKHEKSPFAKQGEVLSMSYDKMLGTVKDGDLVICRNNAPLVEPVFALIRMGVKATIRGRDIGKGLIALCERFNVKSTDDLLTKLGEYRLKEVSKLLKAEKNNQAQTLTDKVDTILALAEGCDWVWQITQKIDEVFSDKKEGVIFSTVHRSKGDEAERVFILNPQLMPSKYAKSEEEIIQERNVLFVALSRSKDTLVFVGGPVPAAFESSEMWKEEDPLAEVKKDILQQGLDGELLVEQLEEIEDMGILEQKVIEQLKERLPEGTKLYTDVKFYENGSVEFEKEIVVENNIPQIPKCPF